MILEAPALQQAQGVQGLIALPHFLLTFGDFNVNAGVVRVFVHDARQTCNSLLVASLLFVDHGQPQRSVSVKLNVQSLVVAFFGFIQATELPL